MIPANLWQSNRDMVGYIGLLRSRITSIFTHRGIAKFPFSIQSTTSFGRCWSWIWIAWRGSRPGECWKTSHPIRDRGEICTVVVHSSDLLGPGLPSAQHDHGRGATISLSCDCGPRRHSLSFFFFAISIYYSSSGRHAEDGCLPNRGHSHGSGLLRETKKTRPSLRGDHQAGWIRQSYFWFSFRRYHLFLTNESYSYQSLQVFCNRKHHHYLFGTSTEY